MKIYFLVTDVRLPQIIRKIMAAIISCNHLEGFTYPSFKLQSSRSHGTKNITYEITYCLHFDKL